MLHNERSANGKKIFCATDPRNTCFADYAGCGRGWVETDAAGNAVKMRYANRLTDDGGTAANGETYATAGDLPTPAIMPAAGFKAKRIAADFSCRQAILYADPHLYAAPMPPDDAFYAAPDCNDVATPTAAAVWLWVTTATAAAATAHQFLTNTRGAEAKHTTMGRPQEIERWALETQKEANKADNAYRVVRAMADNDALYQDGAFVYDRKLATAAALAAKNAAQSAANDAAEIRAEYPVEE